MVALTRGAYESVIPGLLALAKDYPDRDFWHVPVVVGPDSWCSGPAGTGTSDIVRHSEDELRSALPIKAGTGNPRVADVPELPSRVKP